MKRSLVFFFVATLAVLTTGGCATTASRPRSTAAALAAERGAPAPLVSTLQRGGRLSLADIEHLASLKIPDNVTLAYLRGSRAIYQLTTTQISQMREAQVSDRVIDYLLTTPNQVAGRSRGYYGYGGGVRMRGQSNFGRGFGGGGFGYGGGFGGRGFGSSHRGGRH